MNKVVSINNGSPYSSDPSPPLPPSDGGSTYDGMDGWQQSVERRFDRVETALDRVSGEVRQLHFWVVGAAAGTVIALGGIIFAVESFKTDIFSAALTFIQMNHK